MNKQQTNGGYYRKYKPESPPEIDHKHDDIRRGKLRRRIEDVRQGLELDQVFKEVWDYQ